MAINPPSDIIMDVARAADPARYRDAVARLGGGAGPDSGASFDEALAAARPAAGAVVRSFDAETTLMRLRGQGIGGGSGAADANPARAFEAMILSTFVEAMLPADAETVFGAGTAGGIWKSMLADQLAEQLSRAGGLGLAGWLSVDAGLASDGRSDRVRP